MMSRSRAAWFGIAIALAVAAARALLERRPVNAPRPALVRRAAIALGIALAAMVVVTILAHQTGRPDPMDTMTPLFEPLEGSSGGRLLRWQNALPMVRDHLW